MAGHPKKTYIPFTAIVGQEKMKKALILNVINPAIGGVLIRGEKGTAKSSTVRALTGILPSIPVVPGCPFSCDPLKREDLCELCRIREAEGGLPGPLVRQVRVITLPMGATEDRVIGTIDIERALKSGIRALEPGILAAVNRGILYIDEVNLLDDHLVDLLLDAAAMGVNTVEREGISFSHPARFILIGTMNPEEGEIRPQLLDRFGLQVSVEALDDPEERIAVVRVAEEYQADHARFSHRFRSDQKRLSRQIRSAMKNLSRVRISDYLLRKAVDICIALDVRTHRAEITIVRTARTIAAFDGRREVTQNDLREAIELALPHRMRKRPFEEPRMDPDLLDDLLGDPENQDKQSDGPSGQDDSDEGGHQDDQTRTENQGNPDQTPGSRNDSPQLRHHGAGPRIDTGSLKQPPDLRMDKRYVPGRRMKTRGPGSDGHYVRAVKKGGRGIAFDASIRSAVPNQADRTSDKLAIVIRPDELLYRHREGKTATACLFLVDASGSMGARERMEAAKGAILSLLEDSYLNRDRVGLIAFRGNTTDVILPLSRSPDLACSRLMDLPTGGRTPLASGLHKALTLLMTEKVRYPSLVPLLILISDGRANAGMGGRIKEEIIAASEDLSLAGIRTLVIDTEDEKKGILGLQVGYCHLIAEHCQGQYFRIADLTFRDITGIVRSDLFSTTAVIG